MAKIKAVDFAESVDHSRKSLESILNNKNVVDVSPNKSLNYYIQRVTDLPDSEIDPNNLSKYVPDKFMSDFEEEWRTDPLREANGGEYKYTVFSLLDTAYDTTTISPYCFTGASATTPWYIITSDGQEFTVTSKTSLDITWDATKDLINEFGDTYRWIKCYTNLAYNSTLNNAGYDFALKQTESGKSQVLMQINDKEVFGRSSGTQNYNYTLYSWRKLRYFVIGKNFNSSKGFPQNYAFSGCAKLECIKSLDPISIPFYTKDGLYNLKYLENIKYTSVTTTGSYLSLDYLDLSNSTIAQLADVYVKNLILPDSITTLTSSISFDCSRKSHFKLPTIISQYVVSLGSAYELSTITIGDDFDAPLNLQDCPGLTRESLEYIVHQLKDLTNTATKTITLPKYKYIPQYIKDIAINKNWTVAHSV